MRRRGHLRLSWQQQSPVKHVRPTLEGEYFIIDLSDIRNDPDDGNAFLNFDWIGTPYTVPCPG